MAASTKLDMVLSRVAVECGSVIAKIETKDLSPFIRLSALAYYTAVPIQRTWKVATTFGTTTIALSGPKAAFFPGIGPPLESSLYYFLGVCRSDYLLTGQEFRDNAGFGLAQTLAGMDGRNPSNNQNTFGGFPVSVLPDILQATNVDFFTADEHIEYDEPNQSLRVTAPGDGSVTLTLCFGYSGDTTSDTLDPTLGISWNHIDLFGKMVALEFLGDFVASRGVVSLTGADFEVDTSVIADKVTRLQDMIDIELPQISTSFMMLK